MTIILNHICMIIYYELCCCSVFLNSTECSKSIHIYNFEMILEFKQNEESNSFTIILLC